MIGLCETLPGSWSGRLRLCSGRGGSGRGKPTASEFAVRRPKQVSGQAILLRQQSANSSVSWSRASQRRGA